VQDFDENGFELMALSLAAEPPAPSVMERIEASLTPGRFNLIVDRLARFLDVGRDRVRVILERMDQRWMDGPAPGIQLQHVKAGPALAGWYAGLFRLRPGTRFPAHRHLGPESMMVLEGSVHESRGHFLTSGEVLDSDKDSAHDFVVTDDHECIAAVVQAGGMEFGVRL
jgi:anti-sigma factor ChrR (cupin superfamily)